MLGLAGVATTLTSWNPGMTRPTAPPRATFTKLVAGAMLGRPHDIAQQRHILEATRALLEQDAPVNPVCLKESIAS